MSEYLTIKQALISVSDKSNLSEIASCLQKNNINILASGGTAELLKSNNIDCEEVASYTKQTEILGGRVKTLHPKIFGGILSRDDNPRDIAELEIHDISKIDLVIVNLYPFEEKHNEYLKSNLSKNELIEFIDIGGPSLIRAAAKNYKHCLIITHPNDYHWLIDTLDNKSHISLEKRLEFAQKAFQYTYDYEQKISAFFTSLVNNSSETQNTHKDLKDLPEQLNINLTKISDLRYGENPEQLAAVYNFNTNNENSLAHPNLLQGKPLSYNNLLDSNCALLTIKTLNHSHSLKDMAHCAIIKHASPCGVASAENIIDAYHKAYNADNRSAFGGIIAINQVLTAELADTIISNQFVEVLICPEVENKAQDIIKTKPNIRLIKYNLNNNLDNKNLQLRTIDGGLLIQSTMISEDLDTPDNFKIVTEINTLDNPLSDTPNNIVQDLKFSWSVVQSVKSNAIVLAKDCMTLGIGGGQTSRIGSLELAAHLAKTMGHDLANCVLASDAFFPFPDSIELAKKLGVSAIIQPGGSKQDPAVIAKANELGITMVFTGKRKFCH